MTIATYATLKTAVANFLSRSDLTSRIPEFIELAEDLIANDKRFRIRPAETAADVTVSAQTAALPTRFLALRRLYLNTSPISLLEYLSPENFWRKWTGSRTGQPKAFTIEGENFVFGPAPDSSYTAKCLYWQRFAALSADADTNWLLTNARGAYLYGALIQAAPYIGNDPRLTTWSALFDDVMNKLDESNRQDRYPRGGLRAMPDFQGP